MIKFTPLQLFSMIVVMLASFTVPVTVAYNIGAIVAGFDASPSQAGLIASAQSLGTAPAAFIASRFITRFASRQLFITGLAILALGNVASAYAPSIETLAFFQFVGGAGTGIVISVVMGTAARSSKPEMTYGFINSSFGVFIVGLGFVMPMVLKAGGIQSAYLFYAAVAVVGIFAAFFAPNTKAPKPDETEASSDETIDGAELAFKKRAKTMGWIALIGFGIFFFAQSGLGAFAERIGVASEVSLTTIGQVFAIGGLLTIVGPLIAGWIGSRFGATMPLIVIVIALGFTVFGLAVLETATSFYIAAPLFTLLPAILMPSFLGALAVIDPTGRSAAMQPAFATLGAIFGPFVAGLVVENAALPGLGWFTIAVFFLGGLLMAAATVSADSKRNRAIPDPVTA